VDGTLSIGPPIRGLTVVRSIVPAVRGFDGRDVLLEGGDRIQPDAVIAATGYVHGLERLVGNLGVLNDRGQPLVHGAATHRARRACTSSDSAIRSAATSARSRSTCAGSPKLCGRLD